MPEQHQRIDDGDKEVLEFLHRQKVMAASLREEGRRKLTEADRREAAYHLFVEEYLTEKYNLPAGTRIQADGSLAYPE